MLSRCVELLPRCLNPLVHFLKQRDKRWTKPDTASLVTGTLVPVTCSKRDLIAENAFLRQQLIVLKRQTPRPSLTPKDRGLLVALASGVRGWSDALIVVKPNTLKKWHRKGFSVCWRRKSKGIPHQLRMSPEAIALIKQMALENRTWGAKWIRDELRKLGHQISKRTVRKYMKQARRDWPPRQSGQTWAAVSIGYLIRRWLVVAMRCRAINSSLLVQFSAVSTMTTAGLLEEKNKPGTLNNHHTRDRSLALA